MDNDIFNGIMTGLDEAISYAKGNPVAGTKTYQVAVPEEVDIKKIRSTLGMTQKQFSTIFGFPLTTLKKWETGARRPERAARVLLRTIAYSPSVVLAANPQPTT